MPLYDSQGKGHEKSLYLRVLPMFTDIIFLQQNSGLCKTMNGSGERRALRDLGEIMPPPSPPPHIKTNKGSQTVQHPRKIHFICHAVDFFLKSQIETVVVFFSNHSKRGASVNLLHSVLSSSFFSFSQCVSEL